MAFSGSLTDHDEVEQDRVRQEGIVLQ